MGIFDFFEERKEKVSEFLSKQSTIVLTLAFFVFVFVTFSFVYVDSIGEPRIDDHYFHLKYAYLLRTTGIDAINNFDWIHFNGLAHNDDARYNVTLFHFLLIPFTFFSNLVTSLKFADVFVVSASISVIYYSLKKMKVKHAFLISLLILSFEYMTLRFFLGRAFAVVVALSFLEVYFAAARKYKSLAVVSALHVMLHQATFFMPLVMIGAVEFSRLIVDLKMSKKTFIYSGIAILIAMMIYPGFPNSVFGTLFNVLDIQSQDAEVGMTIAGNELLKVDIVKKYISMKILAFFAVFNITAVTILLMRQMKTQKEFEKFDKEQLFYVIIFFMLSVGFLIGSVTTSTRFFDFLILFTVVLSALLISMLFKSKKIVLNEYVESSLKYAVFVFFAVILLNTVFVVRKNINHTDSSHIKAAAEWINERSEDDEVVFLYNWSDFSWMFFYNSDNVYTMGIEPMAIKSYDEGLYWKYYNMFKYHYYCEKKMDCINDIKTMKAKMKKFSKEDIARVQKGNSSEIIQSIRNDFESRFIVSRSDKFNKALLLNKEFFKDVKIIKADNGKDIVAVFELK